jgi:predicted PurR-regulated permease PerM
MVDAAVKVLTFFLVLILILIILNTVGDYIATQIPNAASVLRRILDALWKALQNITQPYQSSRVVH